MSDRGSVGWASDPFTTDVGNPRPWLVVASDRLHSPDEESIAVAFTIQSYHGGSYAEPSQAWIHGEPGQPSFVLPWTVATPKADLHLVGRQGSVADEFTERVAAATRYPLDSSQMAETA